MGQRRNLKTTFILCCILSFAPEYAGGCGGGAQVDMVFILDESGSVGYSNFQKMKEFVRDLVDAFDIGSNTIRVGVQKYSSGANTEFDLDTYYDKNSMKSRIMSISYNGGGTNTGGALSYCRQNMFTSGNGDRSSVPNIAIVITDGRSWSYSATANEARNLRNTGATIFSVGIGSGIPLAELNEMATDPDSDHVFAVSGFSALNNIIATFQAQACPPTNGGWGSWGGWGSCSVTCGGGSKTHTRACNNPAPANGGSNCAGSTSESTSCNTGGCPVNGNWGNWGSYGSCSQSCGSGSKSRTRACNNPARANGGADCAGSSTESTTCNTQSCSACASGAQIDVVIILDASGSVGSSNFQKMLQFTRDLIDDFDVGSSAIRVGVQKYSSGTNTEFNLDDYYDKTAMKSRIMSVVYTGGSTNTGGALTYTRTNMFTTANGDRSNIPNVVVVLTDGRSNNYADTATQAQTLRDLGMRIFSVGIGSGIPLGELNEMATNPDADHVFAVSDFNALQGIKTAFGNQACSPTNGGWGAYGSYSPCTVTCGGGTETRTRSCNSPPPSNGGASCSGSSSDSRSCNTQSCAVNGGFSSWGSWGTCSLTCATGSQSRSRACTSPAPANGGLNCTGAWSETSTCNTQPCPIDGAWNSWQAWSSCSVTCMGVGIQGRLRDCDNPTPQHGGATCPGSGDETTTCDKSLTLCSPGNGWAQTVYSTTPGTPVNGGWGTWGTWSQCTKSCGAGIQLRMRQCNSPVPKFGGTECPDAYVEKQLCGNTACPGGGGYIQTCPDRYFDCKDGNRTCIHFLKKCDCTPDCDDGSDEDTEWAMCTGSTEICNNRARLLGPEAVLIALFLSVASLLPRLWTQIFP